MSGTSAEGISAPSPPSPTALWLAEKVTALIDGPHAEASGVPLPKVAWDKSGPESISFRAATYSFKTAGVKTSWKLSSECFKAIYSADKLENDNPHDGKHVGRSAAGRE